MVGLGELAAPLRPVPGGKGLKLEASLRADERFEVLGEGPGALVRLRTESPIGSGGTQNALIKGLAEAFAFAPPEVQVESRSQPAAQGHWEEIGAEGSLTSVTSGTRMRFGIGNNWVERTAGILPFIVSNDYFGRDPAPGHRKILQKFVPARQEDQQCNQQ